MYVKKHFFKKCYSLQNLRKNVFYGKIMIRSSHSTFLEQILTTAGSNFIPERISFSLFWFSWLRLVGWECERFSRYRLIVWKTENNISLLMEKILTLKKSIAMFHGDQYLIHYYFNFPRWNLSNVSNDLDSNMFEDKKKLFLSYQDIKISLMQQTMS